jgi:hypothetical protein
VSQWAFFQSTEDTSPAFITAWSDYKKQGDILLSGGRGKNELNEIKVLKEVSKTAFTSLKPLNI